MVSFDNCIFFCIQGSYACTWICMNSDHKKLENISYIREFNIALSQSTNYTPHTVHIAQLKTDQEIAWLYTPF